MKRLGVGRAARSRRARARRLSVGTGLVLSSQVRKGTLEPRWDEEFRLLVRDPGTQRLTVDLYDWDRFNADDAIGKCAPHSPNWRRAAALGA